VVSLADREYALAREERFMGRTPSRLAEKWHAFLASDEASFVTGQTISVSGGLMMS